MNSVFLPTEAYQEVKRGCDDLLASIYGVDQQSVTAPAGFGKTTIAQRIATITPQAVYVRHQERLTHIGLLREVTFAVAGARPRGNDACFSLIEEQLARERRLILIDEADRLSMRHLNVVRDLHDVCRVPVCLFGEEGLRAKLAEERRLASRIRQEIRLSPLGQADLILLYEKALEQRISPEYAAALTRHAAGNFRAVILDALAIERRMLASGIEKITAEMVREVCNGTRPKR